MPSRRFGVLLIGIAMLAGCSGDAKLPARGKVTGKITFRGNPVTVGTITFVPVAGGPSAFGAIQPDGTYTLSTDTASNNGDGAVVGIHKIAIQAQQATEPGMRPSPSQLPPLFGNPEKSGLTAEVKEGENVLNIECERTPYQVVMGS